MRTLWVLGVVTLFGCGGARALPITLRVDAREGRCVDHLLTKSRVTGYVEQTVDKDTGFFRVFTLRGVDRRGRPTGRVRNYNVACPAP